jgi:hypothetical protein
MDRMKDIEHTLADEWVSINKPRITEKDSEYEILFKNLNKFKSGYSRYGDWLYAFYHSLPSEIESNGNTYFLKHNFVYQFESILI